MTTLRAAAPRGSIYRAMNWMAGLSLLLFWLPIAGPLIAGAVGGYKAGDVRRALLALILPAIGLGVLLAVGVSWLTHLMFWGVLAGVGGLVLAFVNIGPMLIGAIAGGAAAQVADRARGAP